MYESLCILGRLPAISIAELEALYGAENVKPVGEVAALLNKKPPEVAFAFLGGTVKFCKVLTRLETTSWKQVERFLIAQVPKHATSLPIGKLRLGISTYSLAVSPRQITVSGLKVKKALKNAGRSSRVVPNTETGLNSAQVLYNKLTSELGWELVFVKDGMGTIVAQTIAVQDIDAYARRDQKRPKRDARVGMLPPKLAQTIVNLASADPRPPACGLKTSSNIAVLDPFCGTGVILQEAALMGYDIYGTDIDKRMIEYAKANLDWLGETLGHPPFTYDLDIADAAIYKWPHTFNFMASETYLGRPFTSPPGTEILKQTSREVNTIITKFLTNLASQTKPGLRICLAVPSWVKDDKVYHLPVLDRLTDMGYNRVSFVHAENKDLIYYRPGQYAARELVVLTRK